MNPDEEKRELVQKIGRQAENIRKLETENERLRRQKNETESLLTATENMWLAAGRRTHKAEAENQRLRAALKKLEWKSFVAEGIVTLSAACPVCQQKRCDGTHERYCWLAELLAEPDGPPGGKAG